MTTQPSGVILGQENWLQNESLSVSIANVLGADNKEDAIRAAKKADIGVLKTDILIISKIKQLNMLIEETKGFSESQKKDITAMIEPIAFEMKRKRDELSAFLKIHPKVHFQNPNTEDLARRMEVAMRAKTLSEEYLSCLFSLVKILSETNKRIRKGVKWNGKQ